VTFSGGVRALTGLWNELGLAVCANGSGAGATLPSMTPWSTNGTMYVRQFGMAKEGVIARQFMRGVVQTAEGAVTVSRVFDGNTAGGGTLEPVIDKIVRRFPTRRVIAVADRDLLSIANLTEQQPMALPSGGMPEFILAMPGRHYGDFADLLAPFPAAC
jgi:hypothetical protein